MKGLKLLIVCLGTLFLMKSGVNATEVTSMPASKIQTIDVAKLGEYFKQCDIPTIKHIAETLTDKQLSELSLTCRDFSKIIKPLLEERNLIKYWSGDIVWNVLAAVEGLPMFASSPDGKIVAINSSGSQIISLRNARTGAIIKDLQGDTGTESVKFSDDGKSLVCVSVDHNVRIWDIDKAKVTKTIEFKKGDEFSRINIRIGALSVGGTLFIAVREDSRLQFWKIQKNSTAKELVFSHNGVDAYDISDDNNIIVESINGSVRLVNLKDSSKTIEYKEGYIMASVLRISPNNELVAFADSNFDLVVWDLKNNKIYKTSPEDGIFSIAFTDNSKLLAVGFSNGSIGIVDIRTMNLIQRLEGHEGLVLELNFLPDDKALISASMDKTVRLWRAIP